MPLLTRKSRPLTLLEGAPASIVYNEHLEGDGEIIFREACQLGCEVIVSKRADSAYRSRSLTGLDQNQGAGSSGSPEDQKRELEQPVTATG